MEQHNSNSDRAQGVRPAPTEATRRTAPARSPVDAGELALDSSAEAQRRALRLEAAEAVGLGGY